LNGVDALSLFGLFAVTAMLVFYAVEDRSPWFILAFAVACALGYFMAFCRAHGRSGLWRLFGPASPFGAGEEG